MKTYDGYKKAMDHLLFSEDLWEKVQEKAERPVYRHTALRVVVCAAVLCAVCFVTAFAASDSFRSSVLTVLHLDSRQLTLEKKQEMSFTEAEVMEGVRVRYMPLDGVYAFQDGAIFRVDGGEYEKGWNVQDDTMTELYEVTEDYHVLPTGVHKTLNELFTEKEDTQSKYAEQFEAVNLADKQLGYTGVVTGRNENGDFTIVDLVNGTTLTIPDLPNPETACVQRFCPDGPMALSWFAGGNVTQIGIVDADHGELKLLAWDQQYQVKSWGWLDETRFAVMCIDGDMEAMGIESGEPLPENYLCIYEF